MMITVYTKPDCPYCVKAKVWLDRHGFDHETVDITRDAGQRQFLLDAGHRTVPQLYVGDRLLVEGGYDGLNALSPEDVRRRIAA
jgi:glutaredoxin